jgi:hypothetical protein
MNAYEGAAMRAVGEVLAAAADVTAQAGAQGPRLRDRNRKYIHS